MIRRIFSIFIAGLLLLAVFSTPVFADKKQVKAVYDLAGLFTEDEIVEMQQAADDFYSKTKCNIYIVTENQTPYHNSDDRVDYWGEDFVDDYLKGDAGNSVILIITDNSDRNYNLYTYGSCDRRISDSEVNEILDAPLVYDNIKNAANYSVAITEFIQLSAKACEAKIGLAILIGVIFGVVATAATAGCIIYTYKKKSRSDKYPLNRFANLNLTHRDDVFMGTFITKRVISQGGGRSGSRGGGGGGGHRGGR